MKTYKAMYRCRLCGKTFYNGTQTGGRLAEAHLLDLAAHGVPKNPSAPHMVEPHHCGAPYEDSIGLADFIGWYDAEDGCQYDHNGRCWGQPETPPCTPYCGYCPHVWPPKGKD